MKYNTLFPEIAFNKSIIHSLPKKILAIVELEPVKRFCNMMGAIVCCPTSSAGTERLFCSAALVHTKLHNRLANDRVAMLVRVYRHLGWKYKQNTLCPSYSQKDYEDDIECITNLV